MIEREKQREITEAQLARLERALAQSRAQLRENDTPLFRAMLAALESQIADLQNELAGEDERVDAQSALVVSALTEVPQALIKARKARRLSISELSRRLNINVAELEAYEASGYRTARFEDVLRIAKALSVEISG